MLHIAKVNSRNAHPALTGVGILGVVVRSLSILRVGIASG
jgi:hypothetical protein